VAETIQTIEIPWIIRACCASGESSRYSIGEPWVEIHNGTEYVVATNGWSCCRVRRVHLPGPLPECAVDFAKPNICDLTAWKGKYSATAVEIPPLGPEPKPLTCEACAGMGLCNCDKCEIEHDCGRCKGHGEVPAPEKRIVLVKAIDYGFCDQRLRPLVLAGVRELFVPDPHAAPGGRTQRGARFVLGDVEGIIMPMLPQE